MDDVGAGVIGIVLEFRVGRWPRKMYVTNIINRVTRVMTKRTDEALNRASVYQQLSLRREEEKHGEDELERKKSHS